MIDSFATQVSLSAAVVLMRDTNQKVSHTDKQITSASRRSVWLNYLLSLGAISAGGLSIVLIGAILGTKPAQASVTEQAANLPERTVAEEQVLPDSSRTSEQSYPAGFPQALANGNVSQTTDGDLQATTDITNSGNAFEPPNLKESESVVPESAGATGVSALTAEADAPNSATAAPSALQDSPRKDDAPEFSRVQLEPEVWDATRSSSAGIPVFKPTNLAEATDFKFASLTSEPSQPEPAATPNATVPTPARPIAGTPVFKPTNLVEATDFKFASLTLEPPQPETTAASNAVPKTLADAASVRQDKDAPSSLPRQGSEPVAPRTQSTPQTIAQTPGAIEDAAVYKGPGGASLLRGNVQAQTTIETKPEVLPRSENAPQLTDPLAPTLKLQGAYVYQDESSARARLTGTYPLSPNAMFGGTLDLTTGSNFANAPGDGTQLQFNELYFTGNLPSLPNLRMTVGLIDLTSYFDRNSFAKNVETHFFNPVFQTNPALAAAGIGSRPGILFNWDITDNFQARAAAFSSHRNLGDFNIDGFAGELAFRAGNAIIRGTFASDRDARRDNGFREIYGLPRGNGERGILSGDRENAFGINAEYYIPEIKMGLFGRYGHYENASLGKGGDTFSLGLNFLDLFMQQDRLGFGYGQDLSNSELRRDNGNKVPDVWELFYDFRLLSNLRAGVSLQARDQFSDFVAGFRVVTEFNLLGR